MKEIKKRLWLPASYTVEAAFIIPFILGILFALIYFMYYEHDKVVLQGNMQEAVIQLARGKKKIPKQSEWKKQMQKNLWMAQVGEGGVSKSKSKIKAFGKASMHLHIPVMEYFLAEQQLCSYTIKVQTWQPEQFIRYKGIVPETEEDDSD